LFEKVDYYIALINSGICPADGMDIYPTIEIVDDKNTLVRITQKTNQWIIDFENPPIDVITLQAELIEVLGFSKYKKDE
jgi:hypothetical protein